MTHERAVRVALVRTYAIRHGRDVPLDELRLAAEHDGVPAAEVEAALRQLKTQRHAIETPQGWRPGAAPPQSRAREPLATFSWIH